ncbi:phosphoenolpyruvate carboxykinase (ATP) [Kosmotoga pacifica]|uniref:phosphoenolpyruvate carboxykinase (ATP) n=1 Tax=Kosmotoga pacifica TaxID=1330330 RepID=A0A0G2ZCR8_9BACT|nr:phosphoenolpyruvate carboxykinase (ATP) [Kosmotoga pacifica]AKI97349.1 phosphoenolpyruvate carboxykinase [Kosmotoga pacifica]
MATKSRFSHDEVSKDNPLFSQFRVIIETAFYRNNVVNVNSRREAYKLAVSSPGTIVTNLEVYQPEKLGLDPGTKVLLFNDGVVVGRYAPARRVVGEPGLDLRDCSAKLREAVYNTRYRKMYHAQAIIGLDKDFSVKAHLLVPEGFENTLYNWLLNFQPLEGSYVDLYRNSKLLENEGDIFIFSDPDWTHPDHPYGLTFFDPEHNVAAILGMRYFGEFKKGTLTLAWSCASRNGYVSCHGGQKRYNLDNGKNFVVGVFGLSGSGKSTITHAKHGGKYDVTILHDDAFIISLEDGSSVALEPSYFDKMADYPLNSPENRYLLTVQNIGATLDSEGKVVVVTEDIRNGNGRAIKSSLWSPNRENKFSEPVNAIIWLMKDPAMPPVVKVKSAELASAFGATLATKRTSAERLAPGADPNALVFEPYANPFRTYPLSIDYYGFKDLFKERNVECYIFNTGHFMTKKVTKETTLAILEKIVTGTAKFKQWKNFEELEIMEIEGYIPDLDDPVYVELLKKQLHSRLDFIRSLESEKAGYNRLPQEAYDSIQRLHANINR